MSASAPRWRRCWIWVRKDRTRDRYCIQWIDDAGKRCTRCYPTKAAALRAQSLQEAALNSWVKPPDARSCPELVHEYGVSLSGSKRSHLIEVARVLDDFWRLCHPPSSRHITPALCESFFAQRSQGQPQRRIKLKRLGPDGQPQFRELPPRIPSTASLNKEFRVLHAFFERMHARGYLENPLLTVRKPRPGKRLKPAPTDADLLALLRVLPVPHLHLDDPQAWHLLILLGATTRMRQSALLAMETKRLTLGSAETSGVALYLRPPEKNDAREVLEGIAPVVSERIAARMAHGVTRLFPWLRWQRKAWERITAAAGLPGLTFHSLRALAGTRAAVAAAEAAGAAALGHSSPRVFADHYADHRRLAVAAAVRIRLPDLPPLPPFPAAAPASKPARRPGRT